MIQILACEVRFYCKLLYGICIAKWTTHKLYERQPETTKEENKMQAEQTDSEQMLKLKRSENYH